MRLKLSTRFNLHIGGILLLGICALIYFDVRSNAKLLKEIGTGEAERLSIAVFDQLYTSMRLGGGRAENRSIIERFKKIDGVEDIRIVHGQSLDRQYGIEEDELPGDDLDRAALEGLPSSEVKKVREGYSAVRFVKPLLVNEDCIRCHVAPLNEANGAISVTLSLRKYEGIIHAHARHFLIWGGGIFILTSIAVLFTVHTRLLFPLERLKAGTEALAAGDLNHRVGISTGDELEELGRAFDLMAESLLEASSRFEYLNEKYSKLVQMAPDAILLKDLETGKFVEANPAAVVLTGYSRDELLNMRSEDIYPEEMLTEYNKLLKRWVYDGRGYLHDTEVIKKDGFTVPVEIGASVVELDGKKYLQEVWRDLSERKGFGETIRRYVSALEDTVRERTAELNKSLTELEEAYKKLQDSEQTVIQSAKLRSLGEMGAGIAHELNSPLAGILSITEVLMNRMSREDKNYYLLEKIKDATVRSKYIILDMMTYARPSREVFEPMFLNESIRATLCLFSSEIKTKSIEIIECFDPGLPKVFGNKGRVMEVILNIIKNARDAVKGSGRIYISTWVAKEKGGDFAVAEIRDTGPGIPAEIMDKIFDPFFTTKEKGGGVNIGLGLSISRSIVKEHGGRIVAESRPGEGAAFRIFLPVYTLKEEGGHADGAG